jgi:MscS family membrane protein
MEALLSFLKIYGWYIEIFFIISASVGIHFIINFLYRKFYPKLAETGKIWDDALAFSLYRPLQILTASIGLSLVFDILQHHFHMPFFMNIAALIRKTGLIVLLIWFVANLSEEVEKKFLNGDHGNSRLADKTTVHAILQILRISVFVAAGLVFMQSVGIPISGIIAFGGIGGIAVGFAAKDLLANFFGALMIFLDRPFSIGEWIRSPDRNIEGIVEHIGWRLTRIRTFDKRPLYIPNSIFSNISVENPARMTNRRIYTKIGIRYADSAKMETIVEQVEEMLKTHQDIDHSKLTLVKFVEFAPHALEFLIYAFTKATRLQPFLKVQQDIYLKILAIIRKNGAQVAYPTTTLDLPNEGAFQHFSLGAQRPVDPANSPS